MNKILKDVLYNFYQIWYKNLDNDWKHKTFLFKLNTKYVNIICILHHKTKCGINVTLWKIYYTNFIGIQSPIVRHVRFFELMKKVRKVLLRNVDKE